MAARPSVRLTAVAGRTHGLRDVITSAEGGYLLRCELRVVF